MDICVDNSTTCIDAQYSTCMLHKHSDKADWVSNRWYSSEQELQCWEFVYIQYKYQYLELDGNRWLPSNVLVRNSFITSENYHNPTYTPECCIENILPESWKLSHRTDLGIVLAQQLKYLSFKGVGLVIIPDNYFKNCSNKFGLTFTFTPQCVGPELIINHMWLSKCKVKRGNHFER